MIQKVAFFVLMVGCLFSAIPLAAVAQTTLPQLLINWQASTYAPMQFQGKVLPTSDSPVIVGVDLIDRGKRIDLSNMEVFWYLNDGFYQGARGLTQITLTMPHFIGSTSVNLRVAIPDYNASPAKTIEIPVTPPEVVLQSSAPNLAAVAAPFTVQAYPYFFNVQDTARLNFSWLLNNAGVGASNPFVATRDMAKGGSAQLQLRVSNPGRPIERVTQEITIFR